MMFGGGMMLIWVVLLVGIGFLVKYMLDQNRLSPGNQPLKSVLQILEERYARGEIEQEEFEKKRKDLR